MGADPGGEPDFQAELKLDAANAPAGVRLAGNADSSSVGRLQSMIEEIHSKILLAKGAVLAVDIRELEFMSATCFNVLVWWVGLIHDLAPEQRYRLHFATNTAIPWQRRSLRTLSCFATDLIVVEGP
jgi:hypothetical protein